MFGAALAALGSFFTPIASTVATVGSSIIGGIGSAASAIGSGVSSALGTAGNYITSLTGSGAGAGAGQLAGTAGTATTNLTGAAGTLAETGAGQAAAGAAGEAAATGGMTDTLSKYGNWMNKNPGATMAIGGAAKGMLDYMGKQKELDFQREQLYYQKPWNASSGTANYGSHYQGLTKGLLSS